MYERDNDPEFVRLAAPSTLKTIEMLLSQSPDHPQLLLTACSGFTQYSYGFLHVESELKAQDASAAADLKSRASRMYQRARGYCLHGLEVRRPGLTLQSIAKDPEGALKRTTVEDVPWLYWTAAAWGADISLAPNPLLRVAELPSVRALLGRAKALDDTWEKGAIYEALIAFDGLPAILGGSSAAARADFDRAIALSEAEIRLRLRRARGDADECGREATVTRVGAGDRSRDDYDAAPYQPDRTAVRTGAAGCSSLIATGRPFTLSYS